MWLLVGVNCVLEQTNFDSNRVCEHWYQRILAQYLDNRAAIESGQWGHRKPTISQWSLDLSDLLTLWIDAGINWCAMSWYSLIRAAIDNNFWPLMTSTFENVVFEPKFICLLCQQNRVIVVIIDTVLMIITRIYGLTLGIRLRQWCSLAREGPHLSLPDDKHCRAGVQWFVYISWLLSKT